MSLGCGQVGPASILLGLARNLVSSDGVVGHWFPRSLTLMRIGVLTGGGDAPGLNAAIRGVSRRAFQLGHHVSGIKNGWAGVLSGDMADLTLADVRGILPLGGTILGTSRTNPMKQSDGIARVCSTLQRFGVDGLVAIGGDDTLSVARAIDEAGFRVVGVPKTIDNDLPATEFCIGFDTAVGIVVEALDRLHTTASAHHRVMVVEVMGRDTGWVALAGGLAGGADLILIPEFPVSLADVVRHLHRRRGEGKDFSIIVVAEGVSFPELDLNDGDQAADAFGHVRLAKRGVGDALSRRIEQETGFETRVTVLGHLQRGGTPSAVDRIWATRLGVAATDLLDQEKTGVVPVRRDGNVAIVPLADLVAETRRVPEELYQLTRVFA
jgi:ATP-dependent phosphofructokinase / diphosphate-dependent phosphofructokinase